MNVESEDPSIEDLGKFQAEAMNELPESIYAMMGRIVTYFGVLEDRDARISEIILGKPVDRSCAGSIAKARALAGERLSEKLPDTDDAFILYRRFYASFYEAGPSDGIHPLVNIRKGRLNSGPDRRPVWNLKPVLDSSLDSRRGPVAHGYLRAKRVVCRLEDGSYTEVSLPYFHHPRSNKDMEVPEFYSYMNGSVIVLSNLITCSFNVENAVRGALHNST